MKSHYKKLLVSAIILLLAISTLFAAATPTAKAVDIPAPLFIAGAPNPTGVGETVFVTVWSSYYPPQPAGTPANTYVFFWNFTVKITDPTGNTQTRAIKSDPIGGASFGFAPDKVGTWTLVATFATTVFSATATYLGATSNTFSLTVTQEPTPTYPAAELPTGYWARPINAQNREWALISGNWLGFPGLAGAPGRTGTYDRFGKFNPYSKAPNTQHILWTKPIEIGGLVGGSFGANAYYTGDSYEIVGYPGIIINGQLYYNIPLSDWATGGGFTCVDIRTGKTLWTHSGTISFGQLLEYDSLNQHGTIPYLWSFPIQSTYSVGLTPNTLEMRSASTGDLVSTIVNATIANNFVADENGNILNYIMNGAQHTLVCWNSTKCILGQVPSNAPAGTSAPPTYWRPIPNGLYDWKVGIMWNVTTPSNMPSGLSIIRMSNDVILARAASAGAYSFEAGFSTHDGHFIWSRNDTTPDAIIAGQEASYGYSLYNDIYVHFKQENLKYYGYNLNTGAKIWESEPLTNPWDMFFTTIGDGPSYNAYGKLYHVGYGGTIYCIDMTSGEMLWSTFTGSSGAETPYGQYPFFSSLAIADGKIYAGNGEHSPNNPLYRGESMWCFDANTGEILWKIKGWLHNPMIADGYLVSDNLYDMQWYCFGKGPTVTTIQAPLTAVPTGSEFAITGTVYDKSPSAPDHTPAVSKDSMEKYMEALYEQQPMPNNVTGVPVQLVAIDSSGGSTNIGTVTTDSTGFYLTNWKAPEAAGNYRIVANFAQDESYWSSSAITGITVVSAAPTPANPNDVASAVVSQLPSQAPFPTVPSASDVAAQVISQLPSQDNTLLYAVVAIVVVALLIGLVNLLLLLRKKQT